MLSEVIVQKENISSPENFDVYCMSEVNDLGLIGIVAHFQLQTVCILSANRIKLTQMQATDVWFVHVSA